jgi:response regulator RpfG family c-di-GMP phosphodiesterase
VVIDPKYQHLKEQHQIHVLFVDDEQHNLESFRATFRRYYTIFTAGSSAEAKTILANEEIHILITDQKMPGTTGVQLLEEAVKIYPMQIRIMLTAFSDNQAILDAFQKGLVFKYVLKPWDEISLKEIIDAAYALYQLKRVKESLYEEWLKAQNELEILKKRKSIPPK